MVVIGSKKSEIFSDSTYVRHVHKTKTDSFDIVIVAIVRVAMKGRLRMFWNCQ